MGYQKVRQRLCHGRRCFRLNPRRFSVQRLRAKFLYLFRLLRRWRYSSGQAIESIKRGVAGSSSGRRKERSGVRRSSLAMAVTGDCRLRSNSFYSEAIADCLEFIKRSSISVDEYKPVVDVT